MGELELTQVEKINAEHHACEAAARSSVKHAIRCGEMLAEKKAALKHGEWLPWLEQNFEGSERTAQTYMKLHRERTALEANPQHAADLSLRDALRELATPGYDAELEYHKRRAIKWTDVADERLRRAERAYEDAMHRRRETPAGMELVRLLKGES